MTEARSLEERADAARVLAALSTDDAIDALAAGLEGGTDRLRARIAEALGLSIHPRALVLLGALLDDRDRNVALAAIRAIAWRRREEAVPALAPLLAASREPGIACEAARALATFAGREGACDLARALAATPHDDVWEATLAALADRPLRDTRPIFDAVLAAADGPRRVMVLEALGDASGDVAAVAAAWLADPSPAVRAAAARAMEASARAGDAGPAVVAALGRERDPVVREALYAALANQLAFDAERVARLAKAEASPALRVAAYAALAVEVCRRRSTVAAFDAEAVPELVSRSLGAEDVRAALAAVRALHAAHTPAARRGLELIARTAAPDVAVAAKALVDDRTDERPSSRV